MNNQVCKYKFSPNLFLKYAIENLGCNDVRNFLPQTRLFEIKLKLYLIENLLLERRNNIDFKTLKTKKLIFH